MNNNHYLSGLLVLSIVGFLFLILYSYITVLFFTVWIITNDEIIQKTGFLSRRTEHLELYRVIDYSEKQNILQVFFKNKTVEIESGDKSHPTIELYGIDSRIEVIKILRKLVERKKQERGVYEITNR